MHEPSLGDVVGTLEVLDVSFLGYTEDVYLSQFFPCPNNKSSFFVGVQWSPTLKEEKKIATI